jgi:hypothetical protein
MNIRAWTSAVAALGLAWLACGAMPARADDEALAAALRKVVEGNFAAYNKEDLAASMALIDTKSPDYETTKAALLSQFKDLDVTTELVSFTYIGHDDEFAVARIKAKTVGKPSSTFANNTVDAIVLFHQENGAWKLWGEDILGVQIPQP